ncbi:MAG: hypothetical protein NW216_11475 [Hyphomicrobium sp.]|nr:hypothetical protein [Hyphomicrobium sp.]
MRRGADSNSADQSGDLRSSRSSATPALAVARLGALIETAITVLDEETQALRTSNPEAIERFLDRKGQILVTLNRALGGEFQALPPKELSNALARLRAALEANCNALTIQIEAVRDVTQMIVCAIEQARSDGTYGAPRGNGGYGGC